MERTLFLVALVITVVVSVANAGLDEGRAAWQRGDYATAIREFRPLAEQGNAVAQGILGAAYWEGQGVAKDQAEAIKWYRKAADQGLASAQYHLGVLYADGISVAKDEAEAVKWYRKAADQGHTKAQNNLGAMYAQGRGVARDEAEAVRWYRKAADQGDDIAQYSLGVAYARGLAVAKDEAEAVKWYRKAADQGFAPAQASLGYMYELGRGVAKDQAEAIKWYRKAADQGYALAQNKLASMYANETSAPSREKLNLGKAEDSETAYSERLRQVEPVLLAIQLLLNENQQWYVSQIRSGTTVYFGSERVGRTNVEDYARRLDGRMKVLSTLLKQKGVAKIAGIYDLRRDPKNECGLPPEVVGPITVTQDEASVAPAAITFKDPAEALDASGFVVESSVALMPAKYRGGVSLNFLIASLNNERLNLDFVDMSFSPPRWCKIGGLVKNGSARNQ